MNAVAAVLRRVEAFLIEPAPVARQALPGPLEIVVTGLSAGVGATTVGRGLAGVLGRSRPVELAEGRSAVMAGPGSAVIRDTAPDDVAAMVHRGPGRVLVAVADGRRDPALAALVLDVLAERHERVVLVGNRARDTQAWRARGARCVPESRLGAWLLSRGRRPPNAMASAFEAIAVDLDAG